MHRQRVAQLLTTFVPYNSRPSYVYPVKLLTMRLQCQLDGTMNALDDIGFDDIGFSRTPSSI